MNAVTVPVIAAVGACIRDMTELSPLKGVPSGHLYAQLMGRLSYEEYQEVIYALKQTKLVEEQNHLLTWVGPKE